MNLDFPAIFATVMLGLLIFCLGAHFYRVIRDPYILRRKAEELAEELNARFTNTVTSMITNEPLYIFTNGHMERCLQIRVLLEKDGTPSKVLMITDADDVYQTIEREDDQ